MTKREKKLFEEIRWEMIRQMLAGLDRTKSLSEQIGYNKCQLVVLETFTKKMIEDSGMRGTIRRFQAAVSVV